MTEFLLGLVCLVAIGACLLYLREQDRRRRDADDYEARLTAAFSGLREYQRANDTLAAAVREREQAIGNLMRRLNEASVARIEAGQRTVRSPLVLGLPQLKVAPSRFSRN